MANDVSKLKLNHLTANMSSLIRHEAFDGRDYLVAPVVLMKEGVWNGLLYRECDLKKYPESWNGRPIPVLHPMKDATPITANTPKNWEERKIGYLFNTQYDSGTKKLKSEMWVLEDKANQIDSRIMQTLHNDEMLEVSTGLFTEVVQEEGTFEGKPYKGIATNYRPDHLAVLPGKLGACSVADGAGAPRINQAEDDNLMNRFFEAVKDVFQSKVPQNNELSLSEREMSVVSALRSEYGKDAFVYLTDTYDKYVVYVVEENGDEKMFKRNYEINEEEAVVLEGAVPVKQEISYVELEAKQPQNEPHSSGVPDMEKKVDALITNEGTSFSEDDRDWLMGLDEEKLDKLAPVVNEDSDDDDDEEVTSPKKPEQAVSEQEEGDDGEKPVVNQEDSENKPLTLDVIRKVIREEVDTKLQTNAKQPILERLVKNEKCPLSEDSLKTLSQTELKKLEASITPGNYAGRGTVVVNADNSGVPEMPAWDFSN